MEAERREKKRDLNKSKRNKEETFSLRKRNLLWTRRRGEDDV